jgi:phenylpyruvate tautomerase PptA (4-oxalocrotonate tautomerase family)
VGDGVAVLAIENSKSDVGVANINVDIANIKRIDAVNINDGCQADVPMRGPPSSQRERKAMPHLQLELTGKYPVALKRELACRLGDLYGEIMQTSPELVDVSFRELGDGNVWRCEATGPVPSAVIQCDIRAGRSPEQRARSGEALIEACAGTLSVDPLHIGVEFTQHSGDEIYRTILIDGVVRGGLSPDWSSAEATTPLLATLRKKNSSTSA